MKRLLLGILALILNACMLDSPDPYTFGRTTAPTAESSEVYPESYETTEAYTEINNSIPGIPTTSETKIVVPETYHMSAVHSPSTAKNADKQWATAQNPQSYTIELASGETAAQVANVLYTTPKQARSAELQYGSGTTTHYVGVYGSYANYTDAEQQLNNLPSTIKAQAKIVQWSTVQHGL